MIAYEPWHVCGTARDPALHVPLLGLTQPTQHTLAECKRSQGSMVAGSSSQQANGVVKKQQQQQQQ